ncbi:hypothetical protein DFH29DRAFT_974059, partial [Suillus ampliporus]
TGMVVRSPSRDHGGEPPSRSSRSRSPVWDDRGRGADGGGGHNPGNNLHVSNLSHRVDTVTSSERLLKLAVKKASAMYDPHTRKSRGFGFVTMEISGGADTAITTLNATDIMGKTATVERARCGRARIPMPGRHYGPPKRHDNERPYDPRPYDSRYSRDYDDRRRGGGGGGGGGGGRHCDRGGYRDYDQGYSGGRDYDRGDRGGHDYNRRY